MPGQGSFYRSQHELIFVFKKAMAPMSTTSNWASTAATGRTFGPIAGVNTFRPGGIDDLSIHPDRKPVALVADAMRDCSRRGDIVLDPFMGSGTTIMAAERVGRRGYRSRTRSALCRCRGPPLAAVHQTRRRLKATGQTFGEVAADRAQKADGGLR